MITDYQDYLNYLRLHGHKVVNSPSLWFDSRPYLFQAGNINVRGMESASEVFTQFPALLCRWFEPSSYENADISELAVFPPYGFTQLSKKSRNQTRRGLENFKVDRLSIKENLAQMELIYYENLERLGVLKRKSARIQKWNRWKEILLSEMSIQVWGAHRGDQLYAFIAAIRKFEGMEIILHRSKTDKLTQYPNNALVYRTLQALFEEGVPWVSYGLDPFWQAGKGSLQHFKLGMGFEPIHLKERYTINPKFAGLIHESSIRRLVKLIRRSHR